MGRKLAARAGAGSVSSGTGAAGKHAPVTAHDDLLALADEYWDSLMAARPTSATLVGDHRFDDRIEDLSVEADERLAGRWDALLARVEAVDDGTLDAADRVTRSLLRIELARGIEGLRHRLTELGSDQMDGVHAWLLTSAPELNAPDAESAAKLIERHRQIGTMLDQACARFRAGLGAGRTPARVTIERSLNQIDGYLASDLADDPFVTFAGPEGWAGEVAWRDQLAAVARDEIRPGFQRYRDVLAGELLPVSRPDERCGLTWLGSDGADLYRTLVRQHTTLDDLSADEVHQIGLAEVERLAGEYAEVGGRLFGTSDLAEIFRTLREDRSLRYAGADEIMADARRYLAGAEAAMGEWFGRLPTTGCVIKVVPAFLAADAPAAYYFPPAADGSRPGAYFVNTHEPEERNRFETASVAYHEAIPGHHLQLTIANELTHLPLFQRLSFGNTAFVEGWALYTERLAEEMGLYRDDVERIGMLAGDSWRSCRLVVDTGMHALGWTRQQALDYMLANAPVGAEEIAVEIDRYIAIPGQALAYKVGQLEIQRLRADAQAAAGDAFDIRAFHDAVLGSGSVSLPVLRELVAAIA
jgi:uncharacterized protein (DUF885 family)